MWSIPVLAGAGPEFLLFFFISGAPAASQCWAFDLGGSLREGPKEAVAVPLRPRRAVGHRLDHGEIDLAEVLGGLAIDRLRQVVARRVVALAAPLEDGLVLGRALHEPHLQ